MSTMYAQCDIHDCGTPQQVVAEESRRDEGDELAAYRAFSPKFGVIRMGDTRDSETWSGFHHKHDHGKEFQGEDSPGSTHVDSSPVDGVIAQPVRAPGIFSVTVSRFRIIAGSNRGNKLVNSWKHSIVLPRPDKADGLALDPSEVQQSGNFQRPQLQSALIYRQIRYHIQTLHFVSRAPRTARSLAPKI